MNVVILAAIAIGVAVLWPMRQDIAEVIETHVAFLDDDGLVEVPLPSGWDTVDVWTTLAQIESLPEVARVW